MSILTLMLQQSRLDHIVEVSSWGEYFVNGVENGEMPFLMGGKLTITHEQTITKQHIFKIASRQNEALIIKTHKACHQWQFCRNVGMMRSYIDGSLLALDGVTIMDNHDEFGQEWQVLAEQSGQLFQTSSPYKQ